MSVIKEIITDGIVKTFEVQIENLVHEIPAEAIKEVETVLVSVMDVAGVVVQLPLNLPTGVVTAVKDGELVLQGVETLLNSIQSAPAVTTLDSRANQTA